MVEIAPQPPGFIATPLDADNLPPLEPTAVVVPPPGPPASTSTPAMDIFGRAQPRQLRRALSSPICTSTG
jgi:hypothetical protein